MRESQQQKRRRQKRSRNTMDEAQPAQVEPPVEKVKTGRKPGQKDSKPRKRRAIIVKPEHRAILADVAAGRPLSEAIIAQSYAPSVAAKPSIITSSKSWGALMEEHLPEDLVALRHNELLNKRDVTIIHRGRGKKAYVERIDLGPNVPAVKGALEMAYKLRGSFKSEAPPPPSTAIYNLFYQPHIQTRVRAFEDAIKDAIAHEIIATDTGEGSASDQPTPADAGGADTGATA